MDAKSKIGVFDSGVGGLTVVREIIRQLPGEDVVYFGDTARVPYGSKSKQTVLKYSKQIARFLMTKDVKAIVIACNTASALALQELQDMVDIPVIGVVRPGARMAAQCTKTKNIGVIATAATVKSRIYTTYIRSIRDDITVVSKACPLFVPLVEEGLLEDRITDDMVERYLSEMKAYNVDALVLGCTHYPLLTNSIQRYMGNNVTLVNPAFETAKELKAMLTENNMLNSNNLSPTYEFYASDEADFFSSFANSVLPINVEDATVVDIESY